MRFNDLAVTVIAQVESSPDARPVAWRQLVDIIAQNREKQGQSEAIFDALREWRAEIPIEQRAKAARTLVGHKISPELLLYFAEDQISVAAPLIRTVQLDRVQWWKLLPQLSPPIRSLLRHRDDLEPAIVQALASFGPNDLIIEGPYGAAFNQGNVSQEAKRPFPLEAMSGSAQIRELVERIEAYRREQSGEINASDVDTFEDTSFVIDQIEHFRFETATDGIIVWVEGAPREPLVGLSIAATSDTLDNGVDGYAAGAFRRRAPFRDARLTVAGKGEAAGEWRISAVPFFTPLDGRFIGYRGTARRPRIDEVARPVLSDGMYGSTLRPESLRQLVHELRTPLNAILGFAEMIDGQILGPAANDYRDRAVDILAEARRLLCAVEDLDTAARVDSDALRLENTQVDGASLLNRICRELEPLSAERGVSLRVVLAREVPQLNVDPVALERMFSRLLSAIVGVSERGESLAIRLDTDGTPNNAVRLRIKRPKALQSQDEHSLLDPGYTPDGDWPDAPLLGLGFALRLVRNLAEAAEGRFLIHRDSFALILPGESAKLDIEENKA